jgi:hypothetical protein
MTRFRICSEARRTVLGGALRCEVPNGTNTWCILVYRRVVRETLLELLDVTSFFNDEMTICRELTKSFCNLWVEYLTNWDC